MNKEKYILTLKEELKCDYEYAGKICSILENNFLLGKKNREKIINEFISELNIYIDKANNIYDISISIIEKEIKNKIKHPFKNLDKK